LPQAREVLRLQEALARRGFLQHGKLRDVVGAQLLVLDGQKEHPPEQRERAVDRRVRRARPLPLDDELVDEARVDREREPIAR
jgi:cytosine/adenosine deaminase-related metal-dependent hydrolase